MNEVGEPLQLPLLVVSVLPSWAVPEIVGGDWFTGGACGAAPPVSASPATAASRSSAPTAASPSTFRFVRMSFLSSNACFALLLSTSWRSDVTGFGADSQDAYTCPEDP